MDLTMLPPNQRQLWAKLAGVRGLAGFYLAGGTAAALHLAHRESIDFDFFSPRAFVLHEVLAQLSAGGMLSIDDQSDQTFVGRLDGVRISLFRYPYPLLAPALPVEGLEVAMLQDIVAMKIIAIAQRGAKKDLVDIHAALRAGWSLDAVFDAVQRKFRNVNYNKVHLLKSLTYFNDAEEDPMPKMRTPIKWETVKAELGEEVRRFLE